MGEVVRPYANRVLHPMVVRGVKEVLKCGSSRVLKSETKGNAYDNSHTLALQNFSTSPDFLAFCIVAAGSLLIVLTALAALTPSLSALPFAVLVACPTLCLYSVNIYLQDLFALALTALFFWALSVKRVVLSLLLLFLLQTARESTVVIAAAFIMIAGLRRQWRWMVGAAGAMACAMFAVAVVSRDALPNIHSMGGLTYLATKVVANGAENLFGVTVWSDSYARQLPHYYPDAPLWKMAVPAWAPLGNMTSVGIYQWDGWRPVEILVFLASAFGVLPVLLFKYGWSLLPMRRLSPTSFADNPKAAHGQDARVTESASVWAAWPLSVSVAALAGIIFLVLSPFAGRTVERQIGYAWPLFWLALPWVLRSENEARRPEAAHVAVFRQPGFWMIQITCMWWPVLLTRTGLSRGVADLLAVAGVATCFFAATQRPQRRG